MKIKKVSDMRLILNRIMAALILCCGVFSLPAYAVGENTQAPGSAPAAEQLPNAAAAVPAPAEYKLQPEDVIQITVYEEPELTTTVRVSPQGDIVYPLLGNIRATNFTVLELQTELTRLLEADYLVNPQVQVYIQSYHSRSVSVTGSVNKPGSYQIPAGKPITMMEAIAMAGGFSKAAAINKIKIIRAEGGNAQTILVNAKDIINRGDKSKDVELHPNDVIFVPESWI